MRHRRTIYLACTAPGPAPGAPAGAAAPPGVLGTPGQAHGPHNAAGALAAPSQAGGMHGAAGTCAPFAAVRTPLDAARRHRHRQERLGMRLAALAGVFLLCIGAGLYTALSCNPAQGTVLTADAAPAPSAAPAQGRDGAAGAESTPATAWKKGAMPTLYLADPAWAALPFAGETLSTKGQLPLCVSMAAIALTGSADFAPEAVAGAFGEDTALSPGRLGSIARELGFRPRTVVRSEAGMRRELVQGRPVICIMGTGDFTSGSAAIVLEGIDADGKLIVHDPASAANTERRWEFERIIGQSTSMTALMTAASPESS